VSAVLETKNLTIGYPDHTVAANLNLSLEKGALVCLLGPNGAGKSTLMRTLCGMQKPLGGSVTLSGRDIHRIAPRELAKLLSVVLTERVSAGLLSAYELVALGRYPHTGWSGRLAEADHRAIRESIELVGAQDLAARPFSELSDGERQKVMMARALAQQPSLMVLDEITAFLDLPRRVDIMRTLRRLAREQGCTILLSTHDLDLALRSGDRLWLLEKGGALHIGAPEELVLAGTFAGAFRSEGIEFDSLSGHFQLHDQFRGTVSVRGDGVAAAWTKRALERLGLEVVPQADTVVETNGLTWSLTRDGRRSEHSSITDLLGTIQ